jgi:acetyltransferase
MHELDINPLLVTPDDVVALDARMVVQRGGASLSPRRFGHLAIRPVPDEWTRTVTLRDGTSVILRPIRPEDEPLWHEVLADSSPDTIRRRFRYLFKATTHEMATRFCFLDYDREVAIVAEVQVEGRRKLVGVGRLVADADHRQAEFAVLVIDSWQGRGLGALLTDFCLDICRQWNIHRVTAVTTSDNVRMLDIFLKRGFQLRPATHDDTVTAALVLAEAAEPAPA